MANFIDRLSKQVSDKREALRNQYHDGERQNSHQWSKIIAKHWHPLPTKPANAERRPAYAVDGSNRRANLVNGATLFVTQALLIGEGLNETIADVEILPGTVEATKVDRFADLMRQNLEIQLACDFSNQIPSGSILYLDGALYGTLPQLFAMSGVPHDFATDILENYRTLFEHCQARNIFLVSIAKTNRQPLMSKILQEYEQLHLLDEISDSALFGEWTDRKSGYASPVILGERSFSPEAKNLILEQANMKQAPAIISFFVRFADYDDPLRIDVPAFCVGRSECLGQLSEQVIEHEAIVPILEILLSDYGGIEVYNALAYIVDREVRLSKQKMYEIYLPLISTILGEEIRLDRSERRFVD